MNKIVACILVISMVFTLCGFGAQAEGSMPATEENESSKKAESFSYDVGQLDITEIVFCNKIPLFPMVITFTWTSDSSDQSTETESTMIYSLSAEENCIIFAVRGSLTNDSQTDVSYSDMKGSIQFGENEELPLQVYPFVESNKDSFQTLFAGTTQEVTACAQVPLLQFARESSFTVKLGNSEIPFSIKDIPVVDTVGENSVEQTASASAQAEECTLGETISLDFIQIAFERAETLGFITSVQNGVGSTRNPKEGQKYVAIHGTVKNEGKVQVQLNNIIGRLLIDGAEYPISVCCIQGTSFNNNLSPLAEADLYLFAEVPEELVETISDCRFEFGFSENLESRPSSLRNCVYTYFVELSTDETAQNKLEKVVFEQTQYHLNDIISTDFMELTFTGVQIRDELKEQYNGTIFVGSSDAGLKVLCLVGTIKNTSFEEFNPCFSGDVVIDGYQYKIKDWTLCNGLRVKPLSEVPIYLYASVPESLITNFSECVFNFGFGDNFSNNTFTKLEACKYAFRFELDNNAV